MLARNRLYPILTGLLLLLFVLVTASCSRPTGQVTPTSAPPTGPEASPTPALAEETQAAPTPFVLPEGATPIVISEVLAGVQGNNNYEFIELYNRSNQIVDIQGWALWYRLAASREDVFVYRWTAPTLIPPYGHILLSLPGQDLGLPVDAVYETPINTNGGGLQLRQTDGTVLDMLAWGKAPENFYEGQPAPAMQNGVGLERLPGGDLGNAADSDDNSLDFVLQSNPNPQNTASQMTPLSQQRLEMTVSAPANAEPGTEYEYVITVANYTGQGIPNPVVFFTLPSELTIVDTIYSVPPAEELVLLGEGSVMPGAFTTSLAPLADGESQTITLRVAVPWTYFTAELRNALVQAETWSTPAFAGRVSTVISGGKIPIGTARGLMDADLVVEGVATMYTGALYAGTGNVKFYLQDETGGIQIQVFEGAGTVNVGIGARVQVRGTVGIYRNSMQIVPILVPDDVVVLEQPGLEMPAPLQVPIQQANTDAALPGQLIQIEGLVTRVEEFSYSYEIDIADPADPAVFLTLYVDKQTGIHVEQIEAGRLYRATGVLETYNTGLLLYPRIQDDLVEVFPPEPRLEVSAPALVEAGGVIEYTLTAYNHTPAPLTAAVIQAALPSGTELVDIQDGGVYDGVGLSWALPELAPDGGSAAVHFSVSVSGQSIEQVKLEGANLTAVEWPAPVLGPNASTFTGGRVPVWAIQGPGFRSPYLFQNLTTEGIVTAAYPDLGGFFIQETDADADHQTSEGIFVAYGAAIDPNAVTYNLGDSVQITGQVREVSGQTAIQLNSLAGMTILASGGEMPPPVELDPPPAVADADVYYETLEGMLVQVSGPAVAISPINKYGEFVIVLAEHGVDRLFQGQDNGIAIVVDDGSNVEHIDASTIPQLVTAGDSITGLVGPLAYTFGRYKIEPLSMAVVYGERALAADNQQAPSLQPAAEGQFSIMTWNVENLFDTRDPHPSDPPLPTGKEYDQDLAKVAGTILAAGAPTVVALQEVENIGVLQELAAHELLAAYQYQPVLIEGFDSRGIDVGYLVRSDQAQVKDTQQLMAPNDLFSRPPLLIELEVQTADGPLTVFLLNNHFLSMSAGVEATEGTRAAQAAWNVEMVQQLLLDHPNACIAVMGDLNSFFESLPIQTLRAGGLLHVMDTLEPEQRYSYIYEGESQVLDHILVTQALWDRIVQVNILHTNADYPLPIPGDTSPLHQSDHDPVVAVFR